MFEAAVDKFIKDVNDITGDCLLSVILHGSFVLDDYRPGMSDLDFFAVWKKRPKPLQLEKVMNLKKVYRDSGRRHLSVLEGEFVLFDDIAGKDYKQVVYWGTSGQRIVDECGTLQGFNLMNIRENGFVVFGEDIRAKLPSPTREETDRETVHCWRTLIDYYKPSENECNVGWMLMAARALAWVRTGQLMSKTESAEWIAGNTGYEWAKSLQEAIESRKNPGTLDDETVFKSLAANLVKPTREAIETLGSELSRRCLI